MNQEVSKARVVKFDLSARSFARQMIFGETLEESEILGKSCHMS